MAQTLGELVFDLVLNDKQFHDKLKLAQEQLKDFASAAETASKRAADSFRSVSGAVGQTATAMRRLNGSSQLAADGLSTVNNASVKTQTGLLGFADAARQIDTKLVMAFTAASVAVTAFGAAVTVTGARLENTLNKVAVVGGGGLDELTAAAKRFGTTSEFSAQQAADAMLYFAQAGFDAGRNIAATEASISLAAASGSELARSTEVVSNTISQFGLAASDASRISNVFTYALNASKLGMEDLAVSMKYAGTVGAGFGFSLEETTAAIMQLADLGLTASKSGTVFRLAMTSAANTTQVATKVLEKYGLTQTDINPTTEKFAGILRVVAENNITVADAMKIFGMEAGANIVQLARNQKAMEAGTRTGLTYTAMINGMGAAVRANMAGSTAEKISQTVSRQFARLTASIQSLASDLYGTYSNQLLLLIKEFIAVSQAVADAFRYSADVVDTSLGGAMLRLRDYIVTNRTAIVAMVFDFVNGFQRIAVQLGTLIPIFLEVMKFTNNFFAGLISITDAILAIIPIADSAAQILATVFIATRIHAFVSALLEIPAALTAVNWAATALGLKLTTLTGGTYALILAGGALIAWLISLAGKNDEAAASVDRLTAAQEKQRRANDADYAKQLAQIGLLLRAQQGRMAAEIESGVELTSSRRSEIQQIMGLTAEQALYEKQAGRLVVVNNDLISASTAVAKIQSKEAGSANLLRSIRKSQTEDLDKAREALQKLKPVYESALKASESFQESSIPGSKSREQTIVDLARANGVYVESFVELKLKVESAESAYAKAQDAVSGFNNQMTLAKVSLDNSKESLGQSTVATSSQSSAQKQLNEDLSRFTQLIDEAASRYSDVVEAYRQGAMSEAEIEAERLDRRIQSDNAIYDAAMIAAAKLNDATVDWAQRRLESEAMVRATYALRSMQDANKMVEEQRKLLDAMTQTEEQKKAAAREEELNQINEFFDAQVTLHQNQTIVLKGLEEKRQQVLQAVQSRYAEEDKQEQQKKQEEPPKKEEVEVEVKNPEKPQGFFAKLLEMIEKVKGALGKLKGAFGAIGGALNGLMGMVTTISGFSFDFMSTIQNVVADIFHMQQQSADEAARRAAEAGFDPEAARRRAMVANRPEVAAETQINALADRAVSFAQIFADAIGPILSTLAERLPDIVNAVAEAIPSIVDALAANVGPIVTALLDSLMGLVSVILDQLPTLVMTVVDLLVNDVIPRLPEIATSLIISVIDVLFMKILPMVPEIAFSLIRALVKASAQLIWNLPKILFNIIKSVIVGVGKYVWFFWTKLPVLLFNLVKDVGTVAFEALKSYAVQIGEAIANAVANFFGIDREARQARREDRRARREERRNSFYSGIDYVPATMRATLHQGEAVIPADRNAQRSRTSAPAPAGYAQNFGGGPSAAPSKVEVAVIAEGRLLEAVQLTAQSMGRANGMNKKIRRAAGVQVGFFRGQFNPFSV